MNEEAAKAIKSNGQQPPRRRWKPELLTVCEVALHSRTHNNRDRRPKCWNSFFILKFAGHGKHRLKHFGVFTAL